MSLYYEAVAFLENADNVGGSLTSRIYGKKGLKSRPAAIYALITEATKWSAALKDVVERSHVLKLEKKVGGFRCLVISIFIPSPRLFSLQTLTRPPSSRRSSQLS